MLLIREFQNLNFHKIDVFSHVFNNLVNVHKINCMHKAQFSYLIHAILRFRKAQSYGFLSQLVSLTNIF